MRNFALLCVCLFASFPLVYSQSLKTFRDAKTGVSFSYPAEWSDGPEVAFYLGSEILNLTADDGPADPLAKVGFVNSRSGPYAGTNLSGVQFVYNEIPSKDAAACAKRVADVSYDKSDINTVTLNGVVYTHYSGGDAGLGHGASREIYGTYREGRCILFEESIHQLNNIDEDMKAMSAEQVKQLQRQLDAVMRSVRLDARQ